MRRACDLSLCFVALPNRITGSTYPGSALNHFWGTQLSANSIIEVNSVSKNFGGVVAVNECSLKVERGSITGLIGPNGAGKTTLFNMVAGTK